MKRGEVLFQGPTHHQYQQKCQINVPGICPKFGEGGLFGRAWSKIEKFKIDLVPSKMRKAGCKNGQFYPPLKKNNNLKEVVGLKAQIFQFFQFLLTC